MELTKLLQEGDAAGLEMQKASEALELAKSAVEQAKERFDLTKNYFEQAIARADEAGIPRAKFKKLIEERVAGLWNSGLLVGAEDKPVRLSKAARPPKKSKAEGESKSASSEADDFDGNEANETTESSELALAN